MINFCDAFMVLSFLKLKTSSPHPLSLNGKEQREHFAQYLILSCTEVSHMSLELIFEIFTKLLCNVKNLIEMILIYNTS